MDSKELLERAENYLKDINKFSEKKDNHATLTEYILPAMEASKDTISSIYGFTTRKREGFFGKIKSLIQNKIVFTVINVIEKQSTKQQKFNELTFRAVENLIQENSELKSQIEALKSSSR
jgi:hypothetical protein